MLFLQLRSFQKELQQMKRNLSSFVNEDQLRMLKKRNMSKNRNRGCRWSTDTIQKSLNIRYAVGKKGYEYLRVTVGYPLPAYRTLCENVINTSDLPTCHRLAQIAVAKYIKLRLHIYATNKTQLAKIKVQHGSKSAKARTLIK